MMSQTEGDQNPNRSNDSLTAFTAEDLLMQDLPKPSSPYLYLDYYLQTYFESLGRFAGRSKRNAYILIGITFLIGGICASGNGNHAKEAEERPDRLWIPDVAESLDHMDWLKDNWPGGSRYNTYLTKCSGGCMLKKTNLEKLYNQYLETLKIEVDGNFIVERYKETDKKETGPWEELYGGKSFVYDPQFVPGSVQKPANTIRTMKCFAPSGNCDKSTIFTILGVDLNNKNWFSSQTDASILNLINSYELQEKANPATTFPKISSILSGITRSTPSNPNSSITGAEVVSTAWQLKVDKFFDTTDGNREKDPVSDQWEMEAMCYLGYNSFRDRDDLYDVLDSCEGNRLDNSTGGEIETRLNFFRSLSDEFGSSMGTDQALVSAAPMLLVLYLIFTLGKRDRVHSMIGLSFGAIIGIFFACFAGLGLAYYIGAKDCVLRFNIFFLVLGLGVDDAFVIVSEYDRTMKRHSHEWDCERIIGFTARTSGMSILVTSLTDALAFFVGATSSIPALSFFCQYAACAITLTFIFQLTLVIPLLSFDYRRAVLSNRYDCCCCCGPKEKHEYNKPTGFCNNSIPGCRSTPLLPRLLEAWIRLILTPTGKILVVVIGWLLPVTLAVIGIFSLEANFQLEWFFPSDSYVVDYFKWNEEYFNRGRVVSMYLKDFPSGSSGEESVFNCLDNLDKFQDAGAGGYFNTGAMKTSWFNEFQSWRKSQTMFSSTTNTTVAMYGSGHSNFYSDLNSWPKASQNTGNFQFTSNGGATNGFSKVRLSNGIMREDTIDDDGMQRFNSMEDLRNLVKAQCSYAFPWNRDFAYWEESGYIGKKESFDYWEESGYIGPEFIRNAVICVSVILLIVFAMIPKISVSLPCLLTIFTTIVEVLGFLHWYGEYVNGVVSIYTVICIGLAVDYVAHIGHIFKLSTEDTGAKKVLDAVVRIGPSVCHALFSTLLAVVVLAPSGSFVFSVFFKVLFMVVCFGWLNSLICTPVFLCIFNGGGDLEGVESFVQRNENYISRLMERIEDEKKQQQFSNSPGVLISDGVPVAGPGGEQNSGYVVEMQKNSQSMSNS